MMDFETGGVPGTLVLVISLLTHVLLISPVIYNLVLFFTNLSFFAWHPICCVTGVGFLIMEAILSVSGEPTITSRLTRTRRIDLHWLLNVLGLSCIVAGFSIVFINKENYNRNHITTPHAKLGLSAIIIAIIVCIGGILAKNTRWVYPTVRPLFIKVCHVCLGIIAAILLLATVINGTYKSFWPGTDLGRNLVFASFVIGGFLVLIKPLLLTVRRGRSLFAPSTGPHTGPRNP
ncbi:cytochrome b561 domain-containing protein 2 [Cephus cinctus]|uniref:ascorbate ferrireductase (transmembrane) n=1 Tax=Cephus cinctus TaxID=211228 RepID=A0AAJ7CDB4_CEPCN|nr:cytochrome b561 domain-containing protein 2 [Cephus cinctus]XP_015607716.1 cytochrome b561 domain-containing protein 2 [Cephus cinctus]XP_024946831.1 cytochrome b561 domain-containing protein 2 [Cephus cinctus]